MRLVCMVVNVSATMFLVNGDLRWKKRIFTAGKASVDKVSAHCSAPMMAFSSGNSPNNPERVAQLVEHPASVLHTEFESSPGYFSQIINSAEGLTQCLSLPHLGS
ncbi:hypothetical protein VNO77_26906 [Canavalia gladiata]|uniref:Uncharacterized protein n=1 Tax=Canavalia gladiata TaxID=3824 RepID=A0AAN9Q6P3_CANGL